MIQDDYQTVLKQLLFIALPHKKFNGYAPCPWLAKGLSTGKVLVERGVDPKSIEEGLTRAAQLITKICGGKISRFDVNFR